MPREKSTSGEGQEYDDKEELCDDEGLN